MFFGLWGAAYCPISLKFGIQFKHVTADTLQAFKVEGSKIKVVSYQQKKRNNHEWTSWPNSNLVNAERDMWHMLKVIRSNRSKVEMWQSFIYTVKNTRKPRLITKLMFCFRNSGSVNLRPMSEFWPEAQK